MSDQDSTPNCLELKARLFELWLQAGQEAKSVASIVCEKLESYYLADRKALGLALDARKSGTARALCCIAIDEGCF